MPEILKAVIERGDLAAGPGLSRQVDRMLASPRFGEHLARRWMDLVRYADTHGLHLDNERSMWPYRDWVVKALNDDVPFDRFSIEQLAGDLLPSPTQDQRVATAYNRLHRMTFEGGSIAEEFRQDGINDRVMTAGYGFMGLTMECSRCHDHKYDPISQRDYFSMAAMFLPSRGERIDDVTSPTCARPIWMQSPWPTSTAASMSSPTNFQRGFSLRRISASRPMKSSVFDFRGTVKPTYN